MCVSACACVCVSVRVLVCTCVVCGCACLCVCMRHKNASSSHQTSSTRGCMCCSLRSHLTCDVLSLCLPDWSCPPLPFLSALSPLLFSLSNLCCVSTTTAFVTSGDLREVLCGRWAVSATTAAGEGEGAAVAAAATAAEACGLRGEGEGTPYWLGACFGDLRGCWQAAPCERSSAPPSEVELLSDCSCLVRWAC
jgi:hypothetical protein